MDKINFPKEFILVGTDNNGIRHRYSVEKNEAFKPIFIKFMQELGFDEKRIKHDFVYEHDDGLIDPLRVADINDVCKFYQNNEYEVDVFYGSKKIIMVIRTNQKTERNRREKMLDDLEDKSKWKKLPKKIKPNPEIHARN